MPPPARPAWPLTDGAAVRDELLAAYADPSRGYHDSVHLAEVVGRVDELADAGVAFDRLPVLLAAWFHDAVYDGERDAEERSAAWAEEALPALVGDDVVAEVARLVRLTETHRPADDDANGCVLSDADLGILAAPAERYAAYVAAVRAEYDHLDDATFAAGRRAVLDDLLAKPRLFHTPYAVEQWEAAARANVAAELG
ncbi:HD domain-containing protein [Nocardioides secundeburneus]|uniref:HD domain-containing protein n=1 Tax=Nocardioides sp. C4-1 TaxID=3151851 RepID=UPI0032661A65